MSSARILVDVDWGGKARDNERYEVDGEPPYYEKVCFGRAVVSTQVFIKAHSARTKRLSIRKPKRTSCSKAVSGP
jgi:hypothetical protein